jgi:peptide-methionine (S)-S-oxide reductase
MDSQSNIREGLAVKRIVWMGIALIAAGAVTAISMAGPPIPTPENRPMPNSEESPAPTPMQPPEAPNGEKDKPKTKVATLGAGCFWCIEAVFQEVKGVKKVVSGYMGGHIDNPTYEQVCLGTTGHAEVAQITYDPSVVSFKDLLEVFWKTHDPTTLNRQGNDSGTQYRSSIFYHDDEQKSTAEEYKKRLDDSGAFKSPIVTEIVPLKKFYAAEDYHQNYFRMNPNQGYCRFVIGPKMDKFREAFKDKLQK